MKNEYLKYLAVGVVAVILLAGVWLYKTQTAEAPVTSLGCDSGFFNPVVGKGQVIVSATGSDTNTTTSVSCQFNYTQPSGTASATTIAGTLSDSTVGKTWRCDNQPQAFPKGTTKFTVAVTDNRGETASCNSQVYLP